MRNIFSAEFYQKRYSKNQVKGIAINCFVLFILSIFFTTFNLNAQNTKNASSPLKKGNNISTLQQDKAVNSLSTVKKDSTLSVSDVKNFAPGGPFMVNDPSSGVIPIETLPMFPEDIDSLDKFIEENLVYPIEAIEKGIQGKVYVTFVVEKDGSLSNIEILKDIGYCCGEAAVDLVKKMPKWIPAEYKGEKIRKQFNLPITFSLK